MVGNRSVRGGRRQARKASFLPIGRWEGSQEAVRRPPFQNSSLRTPFFHAQTARMYLKCTRRRSFTHRYCSSLVAPAVGTLRHLVNFAGRL